MKKRFHHVQSSHHASARRFPFVIYAALFVAAGCQRSEGTKEPNSTADPVNTSASSSPGAQMAARATPLDYKPPLDSAMPHDQLGASIRRGQALIMNTSDSLPKYVAGGVQCASCHLLAGKQRDAATLIGVYSRFPKYMDRTGAVISIEDRVNHCFTRSMAGNRIPSDSREMQDIVSYLAFISRGVPVGAHVMGEGMPKMPKLVGDRARGAAIFASTCALCHRSDGSGAPPGIPALWGPKSYSIGASMAREERSASFIRHFMPQSKPGSLTDQQAFDVAAFVNSQPRPDSPGKERDWPAEGVPYDVPYDTHGHAAYRPPVKLIARSNASGAIVPAPQSIISALTK